MTTSSNSNDIEFKKQQAKNILGSYYPCFYNWLGDSDTYNDALAYLNSTDSNINAALNAYFNKYGQLGNADTNNCVSYAPIIYKLVAFVKYYNRFGYLNFDDNKNCSQFKELSSSIENEKLNLDKQHLTKGDYWYNANLDAITEIQNSLNTAYANLSCDDVLKQQEQQQAIDFINKSAETNPAETKTKNYGIYIVYAVVIIIAGIAVKKLIFKN